ncbi:hypothetical protein BH10BAC2_BH10BAC2_31960 [soil metagenome]
MKQLTRSFNVKALFATIVLAFYQLVAIAQDAAPKIEVNDTDVGSWIGHNWMWVIGVIVLLLIILMAGGKSRNTKTTTIRRDGDIGRTTTITTVEND